MDNFILDQGMDILENRFRVVKRLGNGAFGEIYKVEKKKDGSIYAAKIERAVKNQKHVMLFWESKLIHKLRGKTYIPQLYYIGTDKTNEKNQFHVMVMDMLGPSLEDLFSQCQRKFDLKTCCLVAQNMIKRIEKVHAERIIHRDIKPDNFLIGGTDVTKDNIYIIDFGLAKCYKDSEGRHIPFIEGKNLTGTARYASLATHMGKEQARRDDLESIGNVVLYFLKGSLPWQNQPGKNKDEKYKNIKKKKLETSIDELCKGIPHEFKEYMQYCQQIKFEEEPDYKYCIDIFARCMKRNNLDPTVLDYTWKQNRLSKDKENLKNSMLDVIRKKPKNQQTVANKGSVVPRESGPSGMGMQQAPAANAQPLQNAQAQGRATMTKKQFDDKRGSDFKKTAQ